MLLDSASSDARVHRKKLVRKPEPGSERKFDQVRDGRHDARGLLHTPGKSLVFESLGGLASSWASGSAEPANYEGGNLRLHSDVIGELNSEARKLVLCG